MKLKYLFVAAAFTLGIISCKEDDKYISPALNGLTMDIEVGGPSQPNQVYVNLL